MGSRSAVFFDRDGVLNRDIGYLYRAEDFIWMDGAIELIRSCNQQGRYVFVITNQSGIARGYYAEADVKALHQWMNQELAAHSAHIDDFFYCPHHPEGVIPEYAVACDCRKPKSKMIEDACAKYNIDKDSSFMIGDKDSDMQCAKNAGVQGLKFTGGNVFDFAAGFIEAHAGEIRKE